ENRLDALARLFRDRLHRALCRAIAHREDGFDEFREELFAAGLCVYGFDGLARLHDFGELSPARPGHAGLADNAAHISRFAFDEELRGDRRITVAFAPLFQIA